MDRNHAALSPRVAELLGKVRGRMASAPTVTEIRGMADEALTAGSPDPLTTAEIRQLTDVAVARAREIEARARELAQLLTEAG